MGTLKEQIGARFGNLSKEIQEEAKKSEQIKFELIQEKQNKVFKECITILVETIENNCTPLTKNDFRKTNQSSDISE